MKYYTKYLINTLGWTGIVITLIMMLFFSSCSTSKRVDYVSKCPKWDKHNSYSGN